MEALEAILTRRSTRKYKDDIPDRNVIEKIIEAGRHAPSGSNSQLTHFIVFTDKQILTEMAEVVKGEFSKMEADENTYVSLKHSINASKSGDYIFHYDAPVLVVVANKKGYGNAMADSACALENMMIAANALDLGSCWINQLHWLDENERIRAFMSGYGLKEEETITGGLIIGYAYNGIPDRNALERTGNPATWLGYRGRTKNYYGI